MTKERIDFLERTAEFITETIKQRGTEGFAQESIVEVFMRFQGVMRPTATLETKT